jgi:ATP-dependent DNA helicase RecQ
METPVASRRTKRRSGDIECDEILFQELRRVRKNIADEKSVPAYVICGDVTLRQLAHDYPTSVDQMGNISGLGEKKLAEYGDTFANAIATYLENNSRIAFNT